MCQFFLCLRVLQRIFLAPVRECQYEVRLPLLCPCQCLVNIRGVDPVHFRPGLSAHRRIGPVSEIQEGNPDSSYIDDQRIPRQIIHLVSAGPHETDSFRVFHIAVHLESALQTCPALVHDMVVGGKEHIDTAVGSVGRVLVR